MKNKYCFFGSTQKLCSKNGIFIFRLEITAFYVNHSDIITFLMEIMNKNFKNVQCYFYYKIFFFLFSAYFFNVLLLVFFNLMSGNNMQKNISFLAPWHFFFIGLWYVICIYYNGILVESEYYGTNVLHHIACYMILYRQN